MITPLKDLYLISADEEQNSKTESGLYLDTSWDRYRHAVQSGIIESFPLSITEPYPYKNDVEIKVGEKVYFHHFVVQPDNYLIENNKRYYKCPRYHLYCIIKDGIPVMLDDWLLASPILETEGDITKTFGTLKLFTKASPDKIDGMCKAEFVSKECEKQGIIPGDIIYYKKDADYEMKIEGKDYYRMKMANVSAVLRDGELLPIRDEIMIENTTRKEQITEGGIILPKIRKDRQQTETIFKIGESDEAKEFKIGDKVSIFWYTGSGVNHKDKNYIFLRQEEIIGRFTE